MKLSAAVILFGLGLVACGSSSEGSGPGKTGGTGGAILGATGGSGGNGGMGSGGSGGASASTPVFTRAACGSLAVSELQPGTTQAAATRLVLGQLVAARIDPESASSKEHHWALQLPRGFYHLVLDGKTADGSETNLGLEVNRKTAAGSQERLVSGNEIARRYRDEAFFEVTTDELVALTVTSSFGMADYVFGVFANGSGVPSPLFNDCPTVMPLTVGQPASFTLGGMTSPSREQWFAIDLGLRNYKVTVDATQADGADTNLIYALAALSAFGEESKAKEVIFENAIGAHTTKDGTLAIGETGTYWIRLRNGHKDVNVTLTVAAP